MFYIIVICIPVQVIIIPLDCNRNIPNINFRSRITLAVNLWLLIHFLYLNINYSHYNAIALCYRFCCTMWMIVYCYPDRIHSIYHRYKQKLPESFLHIIRDKLIPKVWRNFRTIIERRRREETTIDNVSSQWTVLWMALRNKPNVLLLSLHVIICTSLSCLLKYYTGWDLTVTIPTLLLYLILRYNFCEEFEDIISQLQSTTPNFNDSNVISKLQSTEPPNFNDNNGFHSDITNKLQSTAPLNFTDSNSFHSNITQTQFIASLKFTENISFYGDIDKLQPKEPVSCSDGNGVHGITAS